VPLSKTKPPIEVEAAAPPHMMETLAACGFSGDPPVVQSPADQRGATVPV
jgi:hypothetical protein